MLPRPLAAFLLMKNCCKPLPPRTAPCAWTAFYAFWALPAATEKNWKPRWKTLNSRAARYDCAGTVRFTDMAGRDMTDLVGSG